MLLNFSAGNLVYCPRSCNNSAHVLVKLGSILEAGSACV